MVYITASGAVTSSRFPQGSDSVEAIILFQTNRCKFLRDFFTRVCKPSASTYNFFKVRRLFFNILAKSWGIPFKTASAADASGQSGRSSWGTSEASRPLLPVALDTTRAVVRAEGIVKIP